jgi:type IV pilus assembly protein PilB
VWSIYLSMAEKRKLGEILLEAGLINEFELRRALSDQRQWGRPLGVTLVSMGFVSEAELMRVLSDQLCYPVADLDLKIVAPEVIELVPYEIATKHHCLPLTVQPKGSVMELYLAMCDPTDLAVVDDIRFRTGHEVRPVLVGDQQIEEAILRSYRTGDAHSILKQVTLDDIEDPGAPKRHSRPAAAGPQPVTGPTLELESEPCAPQPFVLADEPEFVLTERNSAPMEYLEEPQIERLREIAEERGVSVASLIRQAVDAFLARHKKK